MFISVDVVEKSNFNFKLVWEKTVCALSHLTLCNPMDCSPPGSSVHGFSRQEYWSGLPCPPPVDLPDPGIKLASLLSPALAGGFFTTRATWEALSPSQK